MLHEGVTHAWDPNSLPTAASELWTSFRRIPYMLCQCLDRGVNGVGHQALEGVLGGVDTTGTPLLELVLAILRRLRISQRLLNVSYSGPAPQQKPKLPRPLKKQVSPTHPKRVQADRLRRHS